MTIVYSVIFALSILTPVGYFLFVRKSQREPWLCLLFFSVCVVNFGYLLLSLSGTVEFALFANKITYLGQVFVPLCMFMIISDLCGFTYRRWVCWALIAAALLMFSLVLTTGHLDVYYKSVELVYADGAAKLVKTYGPLHPINLLYVLAYFVGMLVLIVMSMKVRLAKSQKLVGLMLAVVIGNVGMWIVEKLISLNFEFLSASYLMSEFVFFFVYWILQDYVHVNDVPANATEERPAVIVVESLDRAEKLRLILSRLPEGTVLSSRQTEVLEGILDGKSRKEIAADLHISENTVKMHTSSLYRALNVSSRDEIHSLLRP